MVLSEAFFSWIKGRSTLPLLVRLTDGAVLHIDRLQNDQVIPACNLLQQVSEGAVGIGQDEFDSTTKVKAMIEKYMHGNYIFQAVDTSNGHLAGLSYIPPSPYVRSLSPVSHGGYSVVAPSFQGRGAGGHVFNLIMAAGIKHGYAVMNNRVCVKNTKSLFLTLRHGFSITACIPQSVHLPGGEWAEDFISHADYRKYGMVKLPTNEPEVIEKSLNPTKFFRKEPLFNIQEFSVPLKVGSESAILRSSKQSDIQGTFNLLTSAVQHGDGFAVDEFPNVELFQSRFLNGRQLIILEDRNNIIGVAVIGAAILCRSTNSPCSILYLYVKPKYRKRGYGSAMLKYLEGYLRQQHNRCLHDKGYSTRVSEES